MPDGFEAQVKQSCRTSIFWGATWTETRVDEGPSHRPEQHDVMNKIYWEMIGKNHQVRLSARGFAQETKSKSIALQSRCHGGRLVWPSDGSEGPTQIRRPSWPEIFFIFRLAQRDPKSGNILRVCRPGETSSGVMLRKPETAGMSFMVRMSSGNPYMDNFGMKR
jgi:hypothetical protein